MGKSEKLRSIGNIIISYQKKRKYAYVYYKARKGNGYLECQIPINTKQITIADSWRKLNLRAKNEIPYTDDNYRKYMEVQGKIYSDQYNIIKRLAKYLGETLKIPADM